MSALSQYQNVFRISNQDTTNNSTQSRITKRNRQPVSCSTCRTRKLVLLGIWTSTSVAHYPYRLKCDRQNPCAPCSKKGHAASCSYSSGWRNRGDRRDAASKASEAQLRLQKLEQMVNSLMQTTKEGFEGRTEKASFHNATIDRRLEGLSIQNPPKSLETSSGGRLDVNGSETNYLGATHWATVLENVGVSNVWRIARYSADSL